MTRVVVRTPALHADTPPCAHPFQAFSSLSWAILMMASCVVFTLSWPSLHFSVQDHVRLEFCVHTACLPELPTVTVQ